MEILGLFGVAPEIFFVIRLSFFALSASLQCSCLHEATAILSCAVSCVSQKKFCFFDFRVFAFPLICFLCFSTFLLLCFSAFLLL